MTKRNLSLLTCGLILSASSVFAESSLEEAFSSGKASGDISAHTFKQSNNFGDDEGFTAGTVGVTYETGSFNNFSGKVSFRAGHKFSEVEADDYEGEFNSNAIMHEALIKYDVEEFTATVGRQKLRFEWLTKWNESAVAKIKSIQNTTLSVGFADRRGRAGSDKIKKFKNINNDGIYFIDAKVEAIKGLELNPYYFSMPNLADIYGMKASYSNDSFGILGHYASTNEDDSSINDGSIYQLEASAVLGQVNLAAGYISTDSDGGIGSMDTYGDNIDPTEEIGDAVYGRDANTYYGTISTEVSGVDLGLLYAKADYEDNKELEEVSLFVDYALSDKFSVEFVYTDVASNSDNEEFDKVSFTSTYTF